MSVNIRALHTRPFPLRLRSPLAWGKHHRLDTLEHVLVFVELSDGSLGIAEAPPRLSIYGETPQSIVALIENYLAPMLIDKPLQSVNDIALIEEQLQHIPNNHTAKGAVNMALHMALARSLNVSPLQNDSIESSETPLSFIVTTGDEQTVMSEIQGVYDSGVRVMKVKIGKSLEHEARLIETILTSFEGIQVYVDANQCLNVESACDFLNQLHGMGVLYCEEPLPVWNIPARQQLNQQTQMPIIGDDSCMTVTDVQRELAFDTVDILNIKTARTGFTQSAQISKLGRQHGKTIMVGSQAGSILGCLHAIMFACSIGAEHATEGSFFLKVAHPFPVDLPINNGNVAYADALKALSDIEGQLIAFL